MQNRFYKLPLRFDNIIQKKQHDSCSLTDSIAQNLHLIISTYRGESAYDSEYGCSIWDEEFKTQLNIRWKEEVRQSVITAIENFEKRLKIAEVTVDLVEHESRTGDKTLRVRRKVVLSISGVIKKTNENFNFYKSLFISPLSQI